MVSETVPLAPADYAAILADYLRDHSEDALYKASLLSRACIESGLGPEDLISLHFDALEGVLNGFEWREQVRAHANAQEFLLEVMIAYGVHFKEYLELKLTEALRDAESRAARDREHTHELERLQTEKDHILAVIAHELRTPITVVQGNLEMVARSIATGRVQHVDELIRNAREGLQRLSRLSADLVEASRGEAPDLTLKPLEIETILEQACRWAQPAAASKGINLTATYGFGDTPVHADADALLSVFGNLLSNAVRYTPAGGEVSVRSYREGDWSVIEVHDTGIGMPPEVLDRIFEKFYRAPDAVRFEGHGLGLGLALVQQLVQALKGRIEVESAPGDGTSFRVFIPIAPAGDNPDGKE
jgi:two-component system, OmpR family, sensor histidine kinase BaeS